MRRLIATLVVGGMLLFGMVPAGADRGGEPAVCAINGEDISGLILGLDGPEGGVDEVGLVQFVTAVSGQGVSVPPTVCVMDVGPS